MSKATIVSLVLIVPDADAVSLSQTPAGGGSQAVTVTGTLATGGVATMDVARKIRITAAADETARTFVLTGTNRFGAVITESMTGPDATTADSLLDFKTLTGITVDDDTAGAVTIGISSLAASKWIPVDNERSVINIGISASLSSGASLTYGVEVTRGSLLEESSEVVVFTHSTLTGETTQQTGLITEPVTGFRLKTTVYSSGTVTMESIQSGRDGV